MNGDRAEIFDKLKSAIDEALEELSHYDAAMAVSETEAEKGDSEDEETR
jgi:hypothetical protein